jgi:hypothetical protein
MVHPERCTDNSQAPSGGSSANHIDINLGGATLFVMLLLTVVIGACGVVMGMNLAKQASMDRDYRDAQQQAKLVERRLIDMESYAMLNGWKVPSDETHGPTGNLERMKPKESANGRR